jgi:hypothetical protein
MVIAEKRRHEGRMPRCTVSKTPNIIASDLVRPNTSGGSSGPQDYVVNGHAATKAGAQLLTSYGAPAGHWQTDGYGIAWVADEHPTPVVQTAGQKCWYVLDVEALRLSAREAVAT